MLDQAIPKVQPRTAAIEPQSAERDAISDIAIKARRLSAKGFIWDFSQKDSPPRSRRSRPAASGRIPPPTRSGRAFTTNGIKDLLMKATGIGLFRCPRRRLSQSDFGLAQRKPKFATNGLDSENRIRTRLLQLGEPQLHFWTRFDHLCSLPESGPSSTPASGRLRLPKTRRHPDTGSGRSCSALRGGARAAAQPRST